MLRRHLQASDADYAYCEDLLRRDDKERWLAALFIPAEVRPHAHALYAFSLEAARVGLRVTEPVLGEIRLQWWRDAVEGQNAGEAKASPAAAALLDTMARFSLPKAPLLEVIDARLSRDVYGEAMESDEALESYAEATEANLFRLAMLILSEEETAAGFAAARHAGIACGITHLLRALPRHRGRGKALVPAEILARHGMRREGLAAGQASPEACAALADLRALARRHLRAFAEGLHGLPDKIRAPLLPAALCEPYLQLMEKPGHDPLKSIVELPQWKKQWILWRASRRWG